MLKYKYLFFDLDHTLWDYDTSASQTLTQLYERYELSKYGASGIEDLITNFFLINDELWDQYNHGKVSKYYLRTERFKMVFNKIGVNFSLLPNEVIEHFNHDYLYECPKKGNLISGALDVLEAIQGIYDIHVITNGFDDIQNTKIKFAGIENYITTLITSEKAGAKKPYPEIFEFAMKLTGANSDYSLMIGDNLGADIIGARNYGIDQVYFNPKNLDHNEKVTHEIRSLLELNQILL